MSRAVSRAATDDSQQRPTPRRLQRPRGPARPDASAHAVIAPQQQPPYSAHAPPLPLPPLVLDHGHNPVLSRVAHPHPHSLLAIHSSNSRRPPLCRISRPTISLPVSPIPSKPPRPTLQTLLPPQPLEFPFIQPAPRRHHLPRPRALFLFHPQLPQFSTPQQRLRRRQSRVVSLRPAHLP